MNAWNRKSTSEDEAPTLSKVRATAMRMLGHREQSRQQLAVKLNRRFGDSSLIVEVLDDLQESGLQDDSRFCEMFVRSRFSRGQGERRIRLDLENAGVDGGTIDEYLGQLDLDWEQRAFEVATSKWRGDELDFPAQQKLSRFLMQRGYRSDIVRRAIQRLQEEKSE